MTDRVDHWALWSGQGSFVVANLVVEMVPEPASGLVLLAGATELLCQRQRQRRR